MSDELLFITESEGISKGLDDIENTEGAKGARRRVSGRVTLRGPAPRWTDHPELYRPPQIVSLSPFCLPMSICFKPCREAVYGAEMRSSYVYHPSCSLSMKKTSSGKQNRYLELRETSVMGRSQALRGREEVVAVFLHSPRNTQLWRSPHFSVLYVWCSIMCFVMEVLSLLTWWHETTLYQ